MSIFGLTINLMLGHPVLERLPQFNEEILTGYNEGKEIRNEIVEKLEQELYINTATPVSREIALNLLLAIALLYGSNDSGASLVIKHWLTNESTPHDDLYRHMDMAFTMVKLH
jgi:hypothetical protein